MLKFIYWRTFCIWWPSRLAPAKRLINLESRSGVIQPRVFCGIANDEFPPSNSSRHSKSKHNAIPRSKHFYFSTCKPFAIPSGKLALLSCWPFRVSFSSVIHSSLPPLHMLNARLTCTTVVHESIGFESRAYYASYLIKCDSFHDDCYSCRDHIVPATCCQRCATSGRYG